MKLIKAIIVLLGSLLAPLAQAQTNTAPLSPNFTTPAQPKGADAQPVPFQISGNNVSLYVIGVLPSAVKGRWAKDSWSQVNGGMTSFGDFNVFRVCTTSNGVNATATTPPARTCASGATANTTQADALNLNNDAFIGSAANPTNLYAATEAAMSATTATRFWLTVISDQSTATVGYFGHARREHRGDSFQLGRGRHEFHGRDVSRRRVQRSLDGNRGRHESSHRRGSS